MKFLNTYMTRVKKPEFFTNIKNDNDMTDQSQIYSASITEMAKRFGIDAIIAKAKQTQIDQSVMDKLYGHDLTKLYTDRAELLNTKKKLNNLFENIPAIIRKQEFNDSVEEFINAYTYNDEKKLEKLNKLGIVSTTQLENVKEYNKIQRERAQEELTRKKFTDYLESKGVDFYEEFKKTGSIGNSNLQNNTDSNKDI